MSFFKSLLFDFYSLNVTSLEFVSFCLFLFCLRFSGFHKYEFLHQSLSWKILRYSFFSLLCPLELVSILHATKYMISQFLCIVFSHFFPICVAVWVIFIDPSSSSWILFMVMLIVLLSPEKSFSFKITMSTFSKRIFIVYFYLCVHMCACLPICASHTCRCSWKPEDNVRFPRTGFTKSCESLHVGVGKWTKVLCKKIS